MVSLSGRPSPDIYQNPACFSATRASNGIIDVRERKFVGNQTLETHPASLDQADDARDIDMGTAVTPMRPGQYLVEVDRKGGDRHFFGWDPDQHACPICV